MDRLLFGPVSTVHFVDSVPNGKGGHDFYAYIRKDTFKTAWNRRSSEPRLLADYQKAADGNNRYIKRVQLKPLDDIASGGIVCDGNRLLPINADKHIVMSNGTVYDPATKSFLSGRSTKIEGYVMQPLRLHKQALAMITSKATLTRLGTVLALSAIIDTGFYEIGVYNGYKAAAKGKVPKRLLKAAEKQKTPGDTRMLINEISPVPITLKPLTESKTDMVHPTGKQIADLRQAIARNVANGQLTATA